MNFVDGLLGVYISQNEWNKWKNHFYEMKGDVGMSSHEKKGNKKMPSPRHKLIHNPIPTSLFCFMQSPIKNTELLSIRRAMEPLAPWNPELLSIRRAMEPLA